MTRPDDDTEAVFTEIYRSVAWSGGYPETVSGAGSTLESTASLRAGLEDLFASELLPVSPTILDAPCGDFNWFRSVSGYGQYIGMDIVADLVADNQRRHGSDRVRFLQGDLTHDALPQADVLLCRDCLIHLSDAMVLEVFANFLRSGIPHLLLTTHGNTVNEVATAAGGYRPLNFDLPPYRFPEPLRLLPDHLGPHLKYVGLWTAAQVASALDQSAPAQV